MEEICAQVRRHFLQHELRSYEVIQKTRASTIVASSYRNLPSRTYTQDSPQGYFYLSSEFLLLTISLAGHETLRRGAPPCRHVPVRLCARCCPFT